MGTVGLVGKGHYEIPPLRLWVVLLRQMHILYSFDLNLTRLHRNKIESLLQERDDGGGPLFIYYRVLRFGLINDAVGNNN